MKTLTEGKVRDIIATNRGANARISRTEKIPESNISLYVKHGIGSERVARACEAEARRLLKRKV